MKGSHIGVVVVTHNSGQWIEETLESIDAQTVQPDRMSIIDDRSTDKTLTIVHQWAERARARGVDVSVSNATSVSDDPVTRIAQNFCQGVLDVRTVELVALADHDDVWLPERLSEQAALMDADPSRIMLASDGVVEGTSRTLFDSFDVTDDVLCADPKALLQHVIRHSVATGGASMVRPEGLIRGGSLVPPAGWLHDRWWSLVAASRAGLRLSSTPVVRYRLSPTQMVGLDKGRQSDSGASRWRSVNRGDVTRLVALHALRTTAAPELRKELQWGRLLRNVL